MVIRQAYTGLFQLAPMLFEKYTDFIDIYAEVSEKERDAVLEEIEGHKESVMIAQIIRDNGRIILLSRMLAKKYHLPPESLTDKLKGLSSEQILDLGEHIIECDSFEDIELWIQEHKS
ncbi:MAG: DUF4351 domain-containing protein [Desulfobacterales bacterium]|nr:DUF4351 domain-containing protein [Desulfobacterales bacterium]